VPGDNPVTSRRLPALTPIWQTNAGGQGCSALCRRPFASCKQKPGRFRGRVFQSDSISDNPIFISDLDQLDRAVLDAAEHSSRAPCST